MSLMKRHESTRTSQSCKNSGNNNIVPTHIMLLSIDSTAFIPSVLKKSCRFYCQQHVQITRIHNFDCRPDVGLLLSLVRLVVCWDCHVTSFAARSTCVFCEFHTPFNGYKFSCTVKTESICKSKKRKSFGDE